jgi:hypothetical protein
MAAIASIEQYHDDAAASRFEPGIWFSIADALATVPRRPRAIEREGVALLECWLQSHCQGAPPHDAAAVPRR